MLRRPAGHPGHRAAYNFLCRLLLTADHHPSFLQPCKAEDVFHHAVEPDGILMDPQSQLKAGILSAGHIHNHFRRTHNP